MSRIATLVKLRAATRALEERAHNWPRETQKDVRDALYTAHRALFVPSLGDVAIRLRALAFRLQAKHRFSEAEAKQVRDLADLFQESDSAEWRRANRQE